MAHNWDGNVRELRIYVEYFTYLDKYYVEHDDLPISFHKGLNTKKDTYENDLDVNLLKKIAGNKLDDYCFILKTLHEAYVNQTTMGRNSIAEKAKSSGHFLTQQEIRSVLYD